MFFKTYRGKKCQINMGIHWNQTFSAWYLRRYSYNQKHKQWNGAYELHLHKFRITLYIWRK